MRQGIQELTQTKPSRLSVIVIVLTYGVTVDPELVTPATPLLGKTVFVHAYMQVLARCSTTGLNPQCHFREKDELGPVNSWVG